MRQCSVGRGFARFVNIAAVAATVTVGVLATAGDAEARRRHRGGGGYQPPFASLVVDAKTGKVLHAVNADAPRHPASITKVMTLYMLFEQLEKGKLRLDSPLRVSANAAAQAPSKLGLDAGSTIEVEDAIKALVTKSANDVAVVVAENLGGSEEDFAEKMTAKARAIGMSRTTFVNASGLPANEQITTARDLVTLGRAIQDRFPKYYGYFALRSFAYDGAVMANHNKLLGRIEAVDGIKTGFTRKSGFNLLTSAKADGRHIVAAVLGGTSGRSRDAHMAQLVEGNLPRAYAGRRVAPMIAEAGETEAPVKVAAAPVAPPVAVAPPLRSAAPPIAPVAFAPPSRPVTLTATAALVEPRPTTQPIDLKTVRPVVASTGGSVTTPPPAQPPLRWVSGPKAVGEGAERPVPPPPVVAAVAAPKVVPPVAPARPEIAPPRPPAEIRTGSIAPKPETPAATAAPKTVAGAWVIQLGATDEKSKAEEMLDRARKLGGLGKARPFTEPVQKAGSTLWRARFAGFDSDDGAQAACRSLKRSGFACFATRG